MTFDVKLNKNLNEKDIRELFESIGWDSELPDGKLEDAFKRATTTVSAWSGDRLIGVIRSMDDGLWSANIDCLVVHSEYQGKGVARQLITTLINELRHIQYISVSPSLSKNIPLYEKFGFKKIEGSILLQIVNF